jgi:hypothetical protein
LLDRQTMTFVLVDGTFKGAVGLGLLALLPAVGVSLPATATSVFVYESVAKLASAYPSRKVGVRQATNTWLHVSIASGIALGLLCVLLPQLRRTLALAPLEAASLSYLLAATLVTAVSGEVLARLLRVRSAVSDGNPA